MGSSDVLADVDLSLVTVVPVSVEKNSVRLLLSVSDGVLELRSGGPRLPTPRCMASDGKPAHSLQRETETTGPGFGWQSWLP